MITSKASPEDEPHFLTGYHQLLRYITQEESQRLASYNQGRVKVGYQWPPINVNRNERVYPAIAIRESL